MIRVTEPFIIPYHWNLLVQKKIHKTIITLGIIGSGGGKISYLLDEKPFSYTIFEHKSS